MDTRPIIGPSGPATMASEWIMLFFALILLFVRGYVRFVYLRQRPILSDYLVVLAFLFCVGHVICDMYFYKYGVLVPDLPLARVTFPVDPLDLITLFQVCFATSFPFYSGLYFSKFSILAFIHTIFPPALRTLRIALYSVSSFVVACWAATMVLSVFYCYPTEQNWALTIDACRTIGSAELFDINWSLNVASDILVLLLPFLMFRRLTKLPKREKVGLSVIFSLGIITIGITICRFVAIQTTAATVTQVAVGLIVACLPSLKPLLWARSRADRLASDSSARAPYQEPDLKTWTDGSTIDKEKQAAGALV